MDESTETFRWILVHIHRAKNTHTHTRTHVYTYTYTYIYYPDSWQDATSIYSLRRVDTDKTSHPPRWVSLKCELFQKALERNALEDVAQQGREKRRRRKGGTCRNDNYQRREDSPFSSVKMIDDKTTKGFTLPTHATRFTDNLCVCLACLRILNSTRKLVLQLYISVCVCVCRVLRKTREIEIITLILILRRNVMSVD